MRRNQETDNWKTKPEEKEMIRKDKKNWTPF